MNEQKLRTELVLTSVKLTELGLNHGSAGNQSVRLADGFLITPTGFTAEELTVDDIVYVQLTGASSGRWQPSSEWQLHRDIYLHRPEFNAVVHTHSIAATTLACLRRDIPPFHYMLALLGGDSLRCAAYATFGTQALSDNALFAMQQRKACLLANHGMVAADWNLTAAFRNAVEVENLSELYLRSLAIGEPQLLTADQFTEALLRFETYGSPIK
jgi:L-fuculose-phosphate aldolase